MYFIKLIIFTILLKFFGCFGIGSATDLIRPSEQLTYSLRGAVTSTADGYIMTIVMEEVEGSEVRRQ